MAAAQARQPELTGSGERGAVVPPGQAGGAGQDGGDGPLRAVLSCPAPTVAVRPRAQPVGGARCTHWRRRAGAAGWPEGSRAEGPLIESLLLSSPLSYFLRVFFLFCLFVNPIGCCSLEGLGSFSFFDIADSIFSQFCCAYVEIHRGTTAGL